jgi:hypothetical protein
MQTDLIKSRSVLRNAFSALAWTALLSAVFLVSLPLFTSTSWLEVLWAMLSWLTNYFLVILPALAWFYSYKDWRKTEAEVTFARAVHLPCALIVIACVTVVGFSVSPYVHDYPEPNETGQEAKAKVLQSAPTDDRPERLARTEQYPFSVVGTWLFSFCSIAISIALAHDIFNRTRSITRSKGLAAKKSRQKKGEADSGETPG